MQLAKTSRRPGQSRAVGAKRTFEQSKAKMKSNRRKARNEFSVKSSAIYDMGPVTRGEAYKHIETVSQNKELAVAKKFQGHAERADKKAKASADLIKKGAGVELQERLEAFVQAGGATAERLGSLKVNELKACIAFRGVIPKGTKKADFVSQLAKIVGNVVVPMLICDKV